MSTEYSSKNWYRWKSEHLIVFPWLEYNAEDAVARCRFTGCKMYDAKFLTYNVIVNGNLFALKLDCSASMRTLTFIKYSLVKYATKHKTN